MAQTTPNTPLARVTADFGSKTDLIGKIKALATEGLWLDRLNEDKSWNAISNAKLIRLHAVISDVSQRFGSREKLIDAVVTAHGRTKDADYRKHFAAWPLPRLLDTLQSATHRADRAQKKVARAAAAATRAPAAKAAKAAAAAAVKAAPKVRGKAPVAAPVKAAPAKTTKTTKATPAKPATKGRGKTPGKA